MSVLNDAATARKANVRAPSDRPSSRRCAEHAGSLPLAKARASVELRESTSGSGLDFHGIASVTDTPYEMWDMFGPYTEIVVAGAFTETLATPDLDVPLVLQHDAIRRIARTTNGSLTLAETSEGLDVLAPNLDAKDADVAYIAPKMKSGLIDEMSFRFSITRGQWSADWMEYHIEAVDIHRGDVSIVGYGANPHTSGELRAPHDVARMSRTDLDGELKRLRQEYRRRGLAEPMTLEELLSV